MLTNTTHLLTEHQIQVNIDSLIRKYQVAKSTSSVRSKVNSLRTMVEGLLPTRGADQMESYADAMIGLIIEGLCLTRRTLIIYLSIYL